MTVFAADGKLAGFLNRIGYLIVLNLLTIICCIPIFTAGAAMTALYSVTLRLVRKEDEKIVVGYFKAFRDNFRQATLIWISGEALALFMLFDVYLLQSVAGIFGQVYRIFLFMLVLFLAMVLLHAFAVLARFNNTIKNTVKNALLFCMGHIGTAILMLGAMLIPLILLTVSYRFLSVDILLGISGPAYLTGIYFTSLFKRYE